jgi:hypothetical protein
VIVIKVGVIFQKCDPLLDDALEGLVIFPVSRIPLTIHGEAWQSRPRAAPLERALAVVVFAIVALCARGHPVTPGESPTMSAEHGILKKNPLLMYSTIRFGTASKAAPQGRHL